MKRKLSKEQLSDLAHQAVTSIRRLMSSSYEAMTPTQQDLLSTTKSIEECWQKKRMAVNGSVVDMWATSFQEELLLQIEHVVSEKEITGSSTKGKSTKENPLPSNKSLPPLFISESTMLTCLDVLRILLRTTGAKLTEKFLSCHVAKAMTNYFVKVPFSNKMRDKFAESLLEVISLHSSLLDECLSISETLLIPGKKESGGISVSPQQVHLAWVIRTSCRRAVANGVSPESVCAKYGQSGFLSNLIGTCVELLGMGEGMPFTACLAYFGVVSSLIYGCEANKLLCRERHRKDLSTLWLTTAVSVWKVELTMPIQTNVPGKDILLPVEPAQVWASELTEFIVELSTSDSFSRCRQSLYEDFTSTSNLAGALPDSTPTSPSPLSSPGQLRAACHYEPLPAHWDSILLRGSVQTWRLASLLCNCVLDTECCSLIAELLLGMDTQNTLSESIYRNIVSTLMLLSVATPYNAKILAKSPITEALLAHITYKQESAFPQEVMICGKVCQPVYPLKANTVRLAMGFLSLLDSLYFSEEKLLRLQRAVEEMYLRQTTQTDADIIESFLHVQSSSLFPFDIFFFSGTGSVTCKLDKFPVGRSNGYSFTAWVNPRCVWLEGSHLFSYSDSLSGSSVVLMIVANGRSCSLALRIQHSTQVSLSLIPDTSLSAEVWSHVAFSHNSSEFVVFVNGRQSEGTLNVPFPKKPTKKDRLQLAFGGFPNEPSFVGYIASIGLLEGMLVGKDVKLIYQLGPRPLSELSLSSSLILGLESQTHARANRLSVGVVGSNGGNPRSVSVQNVVAFHPLNRLEIFKQHNIVNWALRAIHNGRGSPSFPVLVRLCVQFICTAMKMTTCNQELDYMTDGDVLERLHEDILQSEMIPIEVPALLISCAIPQGGGKVMREHLTTQRVIFLLLDIIESGNASPGTVSCVLRELSDSLLISQNLALFREKPQRFEKILHTSKRLPSECVENLVVLVERLCKEPREMEQTLIFLLSPSSSRIADQVKAEILRMLFDITRMNTSVCDLIGGAFGNSGASFLIELVGGMNHSSEAIRIYALRIISLMIHTNKKFREYFSKSHGYEVLAFVITDPASTVPIRLPTYNCLFQLTFDALHLTACDSAVMKNSSGAQSSKHRRRAERPQHYEPNKGGIGQSLGLLGHLPGIVSQRLRVTRREYSFDTVYDFARSDDGRFLMDDLYCAKVGSGNSVLEFPQAIQTILRVLERQLYEMGSSIYSGGSDGNNANSLSCVAYACSPLRDGAAADVNCAVADPLDERSGANAGDNVSSLSAVSPTPEDSPEMIALRVLNHLEKIVDRVENGEKLLPHPWLAWLWAAVERVLDPLCADVGFAPRYPKKQAAAIQRRVRHIVRSLSILDLCRNSKAATVRIARSGEYSPALTRLVLEAIVSRLTKRFVLNSQEEAVNLIMNLDNLLAGIENELHLPLALGVDIVNSISSIAVNNNSWVRMRMKNSSRLFATRSHLAFVLLATIKKFSRQDPATLGQLLDANAHEPNTVRVVIRRLVSAVSHADADDVEMLLAAMRQIAAADRNVRRAVEALVGAEHRQWAERICRSIRSAAEEAEAEAEAEEAARGGMAPERTTGDEKGEKGEKDEKGEKGEKAEKAEKGEKAERAEKALPTAEVMQWSREDPIRWRAVEKRVAAATEAVEVAHAGERAERGDKALFLRDRQQSAHRKTVLEAERMRREVEAHLRASSSCSSRTASFSQAGSTEAAAITPKSITTLEGTRATLPYPLRSVE